MTLKKILVVEDNDFVRTQIALFLKNEPLEIVACGEGTQALDLVDDAFSLAIVDVRMEPMGGFEFIRAMQARGIEIPVILATGDHNPDLLTEAAKWGVSAVLMKPVQKDRLVMTVHKTLRTSERAAQNDS